MVEGCRELNISLMLFIMRGRHLFMLMLTLFFPSAGQTKELCVSNQTISFVNHIFRSNGNGSKISRQKFRDTFHEFIGPQDFYDICQNSTDKLCIVEKCLSLDDILRLHGYKGVTDISHQELVEISPALLQNHQTCHQIWGNDHESSEDKDRKRPSATAAWGFGFLFVTIINFCSLAGAVVLPFMKKKFYVKILIFMVALAVGSLAGSGMLVLIPEAFGFLQNPGNHDYLWKSLTVAGGVYLFFLIERVLKILLDFKKKSNGNPKGDPYSVTNRGSVVAKTPTTERQKCSDPLTLNIESLKHTPGSQQALKNFKKVENGSSSSEDEPVINPKQKAEVRTIAWMIIFGDALHNFLDGLSIGAAFTDSIFAGMSISLAVICEELPHELGDFAILLNSGMSVKKALVYNFLSACTCYLGLVLGTVLGANTTAHTWIFAITGGMFLYISLVDMMPEMNSTAENEEYKKMFGTRWMFIVQNIGMLFGFGVIFIMTLYGGEIDIQG